MTDESGEPSALDAAIVTLAEVLQRVAAGDFGARAERRHDGSPIDTLAFLINAMVEEVEQAFGRLQLALQDNEAILGAIADPMLVVHPGPVVGRVNEPLCRLLGQSAEALVGAPVRQLLADPASGLEWLARLLSGQAVPPTETSLVAANDTRATLVLQGAVIRNEDGLAVGAVVVGRDLRQIRDLTRLLEESDRHVRDLRLALRQYAQSSPSANEN